MHKLGNFLMALFDSVLHLMLMGAPVMAYFYVLSHFFVIHPYVYLFVALWIGAILSSMNERGDVDPKLTC